MTVDYISDLHTDFYFNRQNPQDPKFKKHIEQFVAKILPKEKGDIIIIAGDISHYNSQSIAILEELKESYKDVFVVHGNHDLYMISDNIRKRYEWESIQRIVELKKLCEEKEIFFLDGDVVETQGIRIGGTAGWYDLSKPGDIQHWKQSLNDSNLIFDGYPIAGAYSYGARANPDWDTNKFYRDQKAKLQDIANRGCDILVTHVAQAIPPDYAIHPMFRGDPGNIFYYVDNFDILKQSGCEYHIYGHTHDVQEYDREEISFLCNPLGYPGENNGVSKVKQIVI